MLPESPVFMRVLGGSVVQFRQRHRDAGAVLEAPSGVTPKELASMFPHDTADGCIRIPLISKKCSGLFALIDAQDAELVARYRWSVESHTTTTYAATRIDGRTVRMHRLITGCPAGLVVDHVNHDGLDNRRANLRVCTLKQNFRNRARANGAEGFFGVERRGRRFRPAVFVDGKRLSLGTYATADEAARVRDVEIRRHYGEFASLNFPDELLREYETVSDELATGEIAKNANCSEPVMQASLDLGRVGVA